MVGSQLLEDEVHNSAHLSLSLTPSLFLFLSLFLSLFLCAVMVARESGAVYCTVGHTATIYCNLLYLSPLPPTLIAAGESGAAGRAACVRGLA